MAKPGEKFKTEHGVFDNFTSKVIFKLASEGHFEGLSSPLSIGKESNVFAAKTKDNGYVTVKIYRLETADFNRMYDYIKYDPRFTGLLKRRRQVIFTWAQREFRNLMLAREAGVTSPLPLAVKFNVLVEEFIGKTNPAPRLNNSPPKQPDLFFKKVIENITRLYKQDFTHGDLSQYNILNHNENPVFIDFSQATTSKSPMFNELFERDVRIICTYFSKLKLDIDIKKVINQIKK